MMNTERAWLLASSLAPDGYPMEIAGAMTRGILGQT